MNQVLKRQLLAEQTIFGNLLTIHRVLSSESLGIQRGQMAFKTEWLHISVPQKFRKENPWC